MKREHALTALRVAGYHNDNRDFVRVYVENRISLKVANEQFRAGQRARANGVTCSCFSCQNDKAKGV